MRRFYQTEWHGIPFTSFASISSKKLPNESFYSLFYEAFFKKYNNINEIDPSWIDLKMQAMDFIKRHSKFKKESKILSIGCGLGIIEKPLIKEGYSKLEITEVSKKPLQWLLPYISPDKVHIGFFPNCLSSNQLYDFIYLAGIEYFFNQDQLIIFLKDVANKLAPGGTCLMISWSCKVATPFQSIIINLKDIVKHILDKMHIGEGRQFWGYMRKCKEFYKAFDKSGFTLINDGFLVKKTQWDTYWIEATKEK